MAHLSGREAGRLLRQPQYEDRVPERGRGHVAGDLHFDGRGDGPSPQVIAASAGAQPTVIGLRNEIGLVAPCARPGATPQVQAAPAFHSRDRFHFLVLAGLR